MDYSNKIEPILQWNKKNKPKSSDHIDLSSLKGNRKWKIDVVEPFGRCLIAKEDIKEGEILFVDRALIVGPKQSCEMLCLGCFRSLQEDYHKCSNCNWPLCGEECENKGFHTIECPVLAKSGYMPKPENFDKQKPMYDSILPLRCLLLRDVMPDRWEILQYLESHDEQRKGTELWKVEEKNVCEFLRKKIKLRRSVQEIHHVAGILDINCHEIRANIPENQEEFRVRGIFPLTAMLSHDCSSNTHHTMVDDLGMLVVASKNIFKGQQISGTYTQVLAGVIERRKHLKYGKLFDCFCDRCRDPTEFGVNFSGLKCSKQNCSGVLLPIDPTDPNNTSDFVCDQCQFEIRCGIVNKLTNLIYTELGNAPENDPEALESIFNKYQNVLHPNHFHLVGIKHSLSQMYGRVKGYLLDELSPAQMHRKIDCCRDILYILDKLDPGISRLRGITLYELHAPIILQANTAFKKKSIAKSNLVSVLEDCLGLLENVIRCLRFEPRTSFEGQICQVSRKSMRELRAWVKTVKGLDKSNFMPERNLPELLDEMSLESLLKKAEEYER